MKGAVSGLRWPDACVQSNVQQWPLRSDGRRCITGVVCADAAWSRECHCARSDGALLALLWLWTASVRPRESALSGRCVVCCLLTSLCVCVCVHVCVSLSVRCEPTYFAGLWPLALCSLSTLEFLHSRLGSRRPRAVVSRQAVALCGVSVSVSRVSPLRVSPLAQQIKTREFTHRTTLCHTPARPRAARQ